jgi:rhodanese-related sulfurtransferase
MTLPRLTPTEAKRLAEAGARLIDIRGRDEFARSRVPGAVNRPIDELGPLEDDAPVVFLCRSGMRTAGNAARLADCCTGKAYILEGGIDAWKAAGLPVEEDNGQPLELMRQVQIAAGSLVLAGVALGFGASPLFFGLAAFVGAGLIVAGATGWCGMARLLAAMPWNRQAA